MVLGESVTVVDCGKDRYNRTIGDVILQNGTVLNQYLVKSGMAWWYQKYSTDQNLKKLEQEAKAVKIGLWADECPVPPWEWRKNNPAK